MEKKGGRLLQFTDIDINIRFPIVQSMVRNALGLTKNRIGARQCSVDTLSRQQAAQFLNENHIQGATPCSYAVGLFYKRTLVAVMTVGKPRFNKKYDLELLRFAVRRHCNVSGAFSRCLKAINQQHSGTLVSYCSLDYGVGAVYQQAGFTLVSEGKPSYRWVNVRGDSYSRYQTQKHRLAKLLGDKFDPSKSEFMNMSSAGYRKLWDSGSSVWTKTLVPVSAKVIETIQQQAAA